MINLILFLSIFNSSDTAGNPLVPGAESQRFHQTKVDSFSYHYKIVDSVLKKNPYDTSAALMGSIGFMERLTGIKAHPDGDYLGWHAATRKDLLNWRKWYKKHKP